MTEVNNVSMIYIRRELYNKLIKLDKVPANFVNKAVKEKLEREEKESR